MAQTYQPILIVTNVLYILLLLGYRRGSSSGSIDDDEGSSSSSSSNPFWSIWNIGCMILTWGLQIFAYFGILDQAENANATTTTTTTAAGGGKKKSGNKSDLVGGIHLDLLGLTLVIQFMTVLHSTRWNWLLLIVPIYGGWMLYTTFYGNSGTGSSGSNSRSSSRQTGNDDDDETAAASKAKREKRAEKRRQKWS